MWIGPSRSMMPPWGRSWLLGSVLLDHAHAFDDHLILLADDAHDPAGVTLVVAGDDLDLIALFDVGLLAGGNGSGSHNG